MKTFYYIFTEKSVFNDSQVYCTKYNIEDDSDFDYMISKWNGDHSNRKYLPIPYSCLKKILPPSRLYWLNSGSIVETYIKWPE